MHPGPVVATVATTLALLGGSVPAAAAATAPDRAAAADLALPAAVGALRPAATQKLYWSWIDKSTAGTSRTFTRSGWASRTAEMGIVVRAAPVRPRREVRLEYKENGTWKLDGKGTTNATTGKISLRLVPWCNSSTGDKRWCTGTYAYRVRVIATGALPGVTQAFSIRYVNDQKPSPSTTPTPAPTQPAPSPSSSSDCSQFPVDSMDWILCMHNPGTPSPGVG